MMGFRQKQIIVYGKVSPGEDNTCTLSSYKRDNNFILTERKGHSGIYWPALALQTERSSFHTKMTGNNVHQYGSSKQGQ